jgi:hypothetical protein
MIITLSLPRFSSCFVSRSIHPAASSISLQSSSRLFGKSSDEETKLIGVGVSRLDTLQTLLSERGAPGSRGCTQGGGDLVPISLPSSSSSEFKDLHPHLLPLARSQSTGNVICALRRAYADDAAYDSPSLASPWPIVESAVGLPGMRLLSLNSEHLMR